MQASHRSCCRHKIIVTSLSVAKLGAHKLVFVYALDGRVRFCVAAASQRVALHVRTFCVVRGAMEGRGKVRRGEACQRGGIERIFLATTQGAPLSMADLRRQVTGPDEIGQGGGVQTSGSKHEGYAHRFDTEPRAGSGRRVRESREPIAVVTTGLAA